MMFFEDHLLYILNVIQRLNGLDADIEVEGPYLVGPIPLHQDVGDCSDLLLGHFERHDVWTFVPASLDQAAEDLNEDVD